MIILNGELYSKYIVVLEPVINDSREIEGYDACLKPIKQSCTSFEMLDYENEINLFVYMLDRLILFFEPEGNNSVIYSVDLYISFKFQYTQEPRVLIFIDALNDVLKSKESNLVLFFSCNGFSSNLALLSSSDCNYSMCDSIKLGVNYFDISPSELFDIMKHLNISIVKVNIDLRSIKKLIIEVMPVYCYSQITILFEGIDDEGLFHEFSSISNGRYKGIFVGSKLYLM